MNRRYRLAGDRSSLLASNLDGVSTRGKKKYSYRSFRDSSNLGGVVSRLSSIQ